MKTSTEAKIHERTISLRRKTLKAFFPITSKNSASGTRLWSRLGHANLRGFLPASNEGWRKSTNDREGSWYENHDAALGLILKICKGFRRGKQNLYIYLLPGILKINTKKSAAPGHKVLI
jgi:hypothetical protein